MTKPKKIISGNKTLGTGDEDTLQYVIAAATLTVPDDATHNFANDTEIPIFVVTRDEVTVEKELGIALNMINTNMTTHMKLAILKKLGNNIWSLRSIRNEDWFKYGGLAI